MEFRNKTVMSTLKCFLHSLGEYPQALFFLIFDVCPLAVEKIRGLSCHSDKDRVGRGRSIFLTRVDLGQESKNFSVEGQTLNILGVLIAYITRVR